MNPADAIADSPYSALGSAEGAGLLDALALFDEEHAAAAAQRARSTADPAVARAALATAFARRRALASGKFPRAASMIFTRAGYEQATSAAVARHRAGRFAGSGRVVDLCCGIGSDAIALAAVADRVVGVDTDPDAIACARFNARALGAGDRASFEVADALAVSLDGADAAFADPSRRVGESRARSTASYSPTLDAVLSRASAVRDGRLCVKVAPGIDLRDAAVWSALGGRPVEIEVVSEAGTCKEAVLWCGGFARSGGARRATIVDPLGSHIFDGDPSIVASVSPLLACVGEVDGAVTRAGLIGDLSARRGWPVLDRRIAFVTSTEPAPDPYARWYRVRDAMTFNVKHVRAYLRSHGIGTLTVKTRAFPLKPDQIVALLKPRGGDAATLICTTVQERKTAIVCDPL